MRCIKQILTLICVVPAFSWADVSILAPSIAKNGSVVPIEAHFSPSLSKGETAIIVIDGKKAMALTVIDGKVYKLSSRFKMERTGTVLITRERINGSTELAKRNIEIKVGERAIGAPTKIHKDSRLKERIESGSYKALAKSENGFGNTLVLKDSGFMARLTGSNIVANNPFIGVYGSFSGGVSSEFIDNPTKTVDATLITTNEVALQTKSTQYSGTSTIGNCTLKNYEYLNDSNFYISEKGKWHRINYVKNRNGSECIGNAAGRVYLYLEKSDGGARVIGEMREGGFEGFVKVRSGAGEGGTNDIGRFGECCDHYVHNGKVYLSKSEYETAAEIKRDVVAEEKDAQNRAAAERVMNDWVSDVKNMFKAGGGGSVPTYIACNSGDTCYLIGEKLSPTMWEVQCTKGSRAGSKDKVCTKSNGKWAYGCGVTDSFAYHHNSMDEAARKACNL